MTRRPGKFITRVLVFLMLGAIVNVAVAWGCALFISATRQSHSLEVYEEFLICNYSIATYKFVHKGAMLALNIMSIPMRKYNGQALASNPAELQVRNDVFAVMEYGWPLRSLRSQILIDGATVGGIAMSDRIVGLKFPGGKLASPTFPRDIIPFFPAWPAIAVNTILYAGVVWMLWATPLALRRRRRIKRGLCPACAYPVGTSPVCTECGGPIKKQKTEAPKAETA